MDSGIFGAIDANINRALEGIRVAEDCIRFIVRNKRISLALKQIRHDILDASKIFRRDILLSGRDVEKDTQKFIDTEDEKDRKSVIDIVNSNLHRSMEAVRSVEEFFKLVIREHAENPFQRIRFNLYSIEKDIVSFVSRDAKKKYFKSSLYAILDSSFVINNAYLETAKRFIDGGASVIQLRMKKHPTRTILSTAKEISSLCREKDVLFIVNDYPEIAYLSGADGVHLGQDDLAVKDARSILPLHMIIGVSVHSVGEAEAETKNEPDYIAIGPVFDTSTKSENIIKGIGADVLKQVVKSAEIPVVGIGGIDPARITQLKHSGCECYAVVSYLYKDNIIEDNCKKIINSI